MTSIHANSSLQPTNFDANQVVVTVRDSGPGLNPNAIGKIFEPFYTTKSAGMGMGLSICRSIVQNHGGRLWASATMGLVQIFSSPFRSTGKKEHMPEPALDGRKNPTRTVDERRPENRTCFGLHQGVA